MRLDFNKILLGGAAVALSLGFFFKTDLCAGPYIQTAGSTGSSSSQRTGLNIGDIAPDLSLKAPDRETEYSLKDLRGHYVLIDFWASWCGPCRRENPNLVSAWKKYKDAKFENGKGLKIYSISLDKSVKPWKKAISQDNLEWEYHVSDLGGWNSKAAKKYHVRKIPSNFLLDPEGKIIAKDLRGRALHLSLDQYVEEF